MENVVNMAEAQETWLDLWKIQILGVHLNALYSILQFFPSWYFMPLHFKTEPAHMYWFFPCLTIPSSSHVFFWKKYCREHQPWHQLSSRFNNKYCMSDCIPFLFRSASGLHREIILDGCHKYVFSKGIVYIYNERTVVKQSFKLNLFGPGRESNICDNSQSI